MNPTIAAVVRALDDGGVTWCLLRGETELDTSKDVDLLVRDRDLERLPQLLRPLGFVRVPSRGHGPHAFFLVYDAAADRWLKLDVTTELRFGRDFALETGVEEECLARRRRSGELALLASEDGFWALLLHCLLDKRAVQARHRKTLRELVPAGSSEGPLGRLVEAACPSGWSADRMIECTRRGDWEALLAVAPLLADGWPRRRRAAGAELVLARAVRKAGRLPVPLGRRGLSVALLAPDGAGKTTLARSLADSFYFPVRTLYMGTDPRPSGGSPGRSLPGLGLLRRLLRLWRHYLLAQVHESRGGLVIFDRYTYDSLLPPRATPTPARRLRRWLLAHACPAPDLVIVLDAPGDVLHARRPEHPAGVLEEQRRHYRRIGERVDGAVIVDSSRRHDEVRREVQSVIWQALAARIGKG